MVAGDGFEAVGGEVLVQHRCGVCRLVIDTGMHWNAVYAFGVMANAPRYAPSRIVQA